MALRTVSTALLVSLLSIALTACEKPQDKEARYLKSGNELFAKGDYEKARLEYKNAARIMPSDAEPRYRLGLVDEAEGDPRNAFGEFMAAELQNAHYHPALLKIAQYFIAIEEYDQADRRLNIVLGETPDDADGHALRASILLRRKDYFGTEKEARRALDKDPGNVLGTAVLTGMYAAENDQAKAEAVIDAGIAHNPNDISLRLLKVMLYEQSANITKVAQAYQDIFKLKPTEELFRSDLARIYVKSGKLDEAEATLRGGVNAMPADWDMKKDLVFFLGEHRSLDAAEKEVHALMRQYPDNDDLYFWLADLYTTHNAPDRAMALLEQIIARNQTDHTALNARTSLAHIQFVRGNRQLAQKLLTAVLDNDPSNAGALLIRAQIAYDDGRYQEAVADLRTIIRDDPHSQEALQMLAETFLMQGRIDLSIDSLNQLTDINPGNTAALIRLAQMYNLDGNSKRALELLSAATRNAPRNPVGWESMARIDIGLKDWQGAEDAIKQLDTIDGQHATATFLRGQILAGTEKPQDAVALYMQVISADPKSPLAEHAMTALVDADQRINKLPDAIATLQSVKADTPFVATLLGGCYLKLNKPDDAAAAFDKAIAEKSDSPETYLARAQLYIRDNKVEEALQVLKKGQDNIPADIRAPAMAAGLLGKLGRYQEAIAIYNDVLAHHPGADAVANNLAQMIADYEYSDTGALDKARQIAERFVRSDNPLYLDTLSWVYYRQGNVPEAMTVMQRVMAARNLPPEVHYHYGILLLKSGRPDAAKEELKQAVAQNVAYPGLEDAKKTLSGL